MGIKDYRCGNCTSGPPQQIAELFQFNFCTNCGHLYPATVKHIKKYFRLLMLSEELEKTERLICKSEFNSAVREAVVQLENIIKEKSGLKDLNGQNLISHAFGFKVDPKNDFVITEYPRIQVNNLSNINERNEQEGLKLQLMGFMQGIRNVYMHTEGSPILYSTLPIVSMVDMFIKQIHRSITVDS